LQSSPEPIAPDEFGPYEVYERLGLGGMATVCRAKKRGPAGFERSVALKRMLSHLSEDQTFVESFIREAKVSSMLVHPNIAQVYDFGRINGTYYIAMELVPGFDLRKLLRYANRANESIPLAVVLSILGEMCDALEYAHTCHDEQGQPLRIVHRDISPSNIIVAHTGHTKLIDFGIAKANSRTLHTESGQVKGKLGYMSPEAALGMPIGPVSDVFSMGVVAWELVTASPLFSARTDFETMRKIREAEVVKPSTHNPACPPELDRLILSALERDNTRRLPTAAQFRLALDQIAAREGIQVGTRAVGEWIRQYIQPEDMARYSGRVVPQDAVTSILRPSAKSRLQRSQDDIELAAEIWGDDANSIAGPAGDFSIAGAAQNVPSTATPMPTQVPVGQLGTQPTAHYTPSQNFGAPPQRLPLQASPSYPQIPAGYLPAPMQQILPHAVPAPPSVKASRTGVYLLLGLGAVAVALGIVLLMKRGTPAATTGGVRVALDPANAVVELDGKPLTAGPIEPGEHTLVAHADGFKRLEKQITVVAGPPLALELKLDPAIAHVAIDSTPRGLPIELDGKPAGTTPTKLETLAGAHRVVVKGAADAWTKDFVASADANLDYTATFAPVKPGTPAVATNPHRPPVKDKHRDKHPVVAEADPPPVKIEPVPPPVVTHPVAPPVQPPVQQPVPDPPKPTRTPVVAATAVAKVSGDLPVMRGDHDGDVLVKMCIDEAGKVTSVKIVKTSPDMPSDLVGALQSWRYKPYLGKEAKPQAVCFALSLRVVVKHD